MSCVYISVFTIRLDLAFGFVCLGLSLWMFVWPYLVLSCLLSVLSCLVLSMSETQIYAWGPSLVVFVFAQDPSCSPWELWPLEASVGPKWFCGAGSSGSALSAINVASCVFGDVCPPCVQQKPNELLEVRFQRCLLVPHDGCIALRSICWPDVVMWNWFQWCAFSTKSPLELARSVIAFHVL